MHYAFPPLLVTLLVTASSVWATGPVFVQQSYLKGSNNAASDNFGNSVAIDGDTIVVGAPLNDTNADNAGLAYVFIRDAGGNWSQQAILAPPFPRAEDRFGHSVAISGNTIVVSAHLDDNIFQGVNPGYSFGDSTQNSGAVYVFTRNGTALSETADSDGDGIPDATEFRLSALGFDWQVSQPELVAILFGNAAGAGLFTEAQVRDLNLPVPIIKRNPATNRFTLEIGLERSDDLNAFDPFPFTIDDTTITPDGRIEFGFPGTGGAEFFRPRTR